MPRDTDPITDSVWMRPVRARRGRPQLSREEIVTAAVELLDAEGLDGLSMRRLGATIGAGATSLYFYVANKDELLELAIDEIMGEVVGPDAAEVGWRVAAGDYARGMRSMILRHPWAIGIFGVKPNIGPNAMRVGDRAIGLLTAAGFTGQEISWASSLLTSHAIGTAVTEAATRTMTAQTGQNANDIVDKMEPYIQRIAADHPNLSAWWLENKDVHLEKGQEDGFDFGLERLLDGLEAWLARKSTHTQRSTSAEHQDLPATP
ncbi:TetR/AcrR family transcriptional regulator [Actinomadura citrea]|uniref:AcrR family transcriptional regulator n=1 Tax=Actinomadura citrea TaxID=46158 RepID=A0A7Y9KGL5_9ACTN|nr:TetR/AcrR family transcriptional regulator [Actinomadura citrea]NYE14844.1 AcrR family transcriptional regulator [Actinomadura citrea]GGT82486.1 TetR family transcriptional regulator [Actinomadura citrea]